MHARPSQLRGFTLMELILVMIIISIMLLLATPSLRGWGQGQKLRNATDDFIAATGYARSQAVTTAKPHAVEIDPGAGTFVVQSIEPGGVRTAVRGDMGSVRKLPESFTIRLVSGGDTGNADGAAPAKGGAVVLLFYPDARGTTAAVEIKSPSGETALIASDSPAEPFKKVDAAS